MRTENGLGVYAVDIRVIAKPISKNSRLPKIDKTLRRYPVTLGNNGEVISRRFISKVVPRDNQSNYFIDFEILSKKFLSNICYELKKS